MRSRTCSKRARGLIAALRKALAFLLCALSLASLVHESAAAQSAASTTLQEFIEVCVDVDEVDSLVARAPQLGWQLVGDSEVAFLSRRIDDFESSMLAGMSGWREAVYAFRKTLGGNELFLLVEDHRMPETANLLRMNTCEVFDFMSPPTYKEAAEIFGTTHTKHDGRHPPNRDFETGFGVSWNDELGLRGASNTKIWTWKDDERGPFVIYEAQRSFWKPSWAKPAGTVPPIPPPPIPTRLPNTESDDDQSRN